MRYLWDRGTTNIEFKLDWFRGSGDWKDACLAVIQDESMKLFRCWIICMSSCKELTLSVELMGLYSKISSVYRACCLGRGED